MTLRKLLDLFYKRTTHKEFIDYKFEVMIQEGQDTATFKEIQSIFEINNETKTITFKLK